MICNCKVCFVFTCLLVALAELTDLERLIIDEVFFSPDKRPSLEELGNKHNISRQAYSRKLNRTLHKLRILIEQDITAFAEGYFKHAFQRGE